jgi:hypothetical protein
VRTQIVDYQIVLTQPWVTAAPGGATYEPGHVLYIGYGPPDRGGPGQSGWAPEGWVCVIGHGMAETIPATHLKVVRRQFDLTGTTEAPWTEMGVSVPSTAS